MARSRTVVANWFDYPHYYDIVFQSHTRQEADFIEAACRKYCPFDVHRFLEPACGSGRLVTELAARGYHVTGFDLNRPALSYLRRRLGRLRLHAATFEANMSDFRVTEPIDAAYCTVGTFCHLLTEQAARRHLNCIAGSLRPGGIYVLAFRALPLNADEENVQHWTESRGRTKVTATLRVLHMDLRRRIEDVRVCLVGRRGSNELRLRHDFQLRTYTARQFRRLLGSVPLLELWNTYDFRYNIEQPFAPNDEMGYCLFVLGRRLPCRRAFGIREPHRSQRVLTFKTRFKRSQKSA
jgi:SAM-dependent methyltransferase